MNLQNKRTKANNKGITLIALVITIIVLLILAGVAIAMLSGDNGLLNKTVKSLEEQSHASVNEAMILAYDEYIIEIKTATKEQNVREISELASTDTIKVADNGTENTKTFWQFILDKGCIDEKGKIDTQKLVGNRTSLGNGSGREDVYVLEFEDTETEAEKGSIKYVVNYYDGYATETRLIWNVATSDEEPIIPVDPGIFETSLERRRDNNNRY